MYSQVKGVNQDAQTTSSQLRQHFSNDEGDLHSRLGVLHTCHNMVVRAEQLLGGAEAAT